LTIQTNYVVSMVQKLFYKFKLLKDILNTKTLRTVYLTLVKFIISYGPILLLFGEMHQVCFKSAYDYIKLTVMIYTIEIV